MLATKIVDAAIKVHTALGPGLLESAYQKCMQYELQKKGLKLDCELALPIKANFEQKRNFSSIAEGVITLAHSPQPACSSFDSLIREISPAPLPIRVYPILSLS